MKDNEKNLLNSFFDDTVIESEDAKFAAAVALAIEYGKISTSLLQRRLCLGYNRAAKIIDKMEDCGFISASDGNAPRRVLITNEEYEKLLEKYKFTD